MDERNESQYEPIPYAQYVGYYGLPTEKREGILGLITLIFGFLAVNGLIVGGLNLAVALGLLGVLTAAVVYLFHSGCRGSWYSQTLLVFSALILTGFARSDDGFVKFILLGFYFVSANLGLTLLSGKNRYIPEGAASLLDPFATFFGLGFGKMGTAFRGIRTAVFQGGKTVKNSGAVLLGAAITLPILAIMVPLLMRADAAFEGMLDLLPGLNMRRFLLTVLLGIPMICVYYARTVALHRGIPTTQAQPKSRKYLNRLTVNTVLISVNILYAMYLFSQLAYFVGGFRGILPEGYSLANYARRGFFEMAWLCAINLSIMILAGSLSEKKTGKTPLSTRLCCLFLGAVTLFLVIASGTKMGMYMASYGLTRLRVLTGVIIAFLGITTIIMCIWLLRPQLGYMKIILLCALLLGTAVLWVDVDTLVASYNTQAYLSGQLESMDMLHLSGLGSGAVPSLDRLAREAGDKAVRQQALDILRQWDLKDDWRCWNLTDHVARKYLENWSS